MIMQNVDVKLKLRISMAKGTFNKKRVLSSRKLDII